MCNYNRKYYLLQPGQLVQEVNIKTKWHIHFSWVRCMNSSILFLFKNYKKMNKEKYLYVNEIIFKVVNLSAWSYSWFRLHRCEMSPFCGEDYWWLKHKSKFWNLRIFLQYPMQVSKGKKIGIDLHPHKKWHFSAGLLSLRVKLPLVTPASHTNAGSGPGYLASDPGLGQRPRKGSKWWSKDLGPCYSHKRLGWSSWLLNWFCSILLWLQPFGSEALLHRLVSSLSFLSLSSPPLHSPLFSHPPSLSLSHFPINI